MGIGFGLIELIGIGVIALGGGGFLIYYLLGSGKGDE